MLGSVSRRMSIDVPNLARKSPRVVSKNVAAMRAEQKSASMQSERRVKKALTRLAGARTLDPRPEGHVLIVLRHHGGDHGVWHSPFAVLGVERVIDGLEAER